MSDEQKYEEVLSRVAVKCLYALDPINTRERVVQLVKDIYSLVTPDDAFDGDDDVDSDAA
jgi:hypothetical protein